MKMRRPPWIRQCVLQLLVNFLGGREVIPQNCPRSALPTPTCLYIIMQEILDPLLYCTMMVCHSDKYLKVVEVYNNVA